MADDGIVPDVLVAVSSLPESLFYRNNTGAGEMHGRWIAFGLKGSGDIMGCRRGRAVAIECKARRGRLARQQKDFRAAWERAGGLYVVARSVDDALKALANV